MGIYVNGKLIAGTRGHSVGTMSKDVITLEGGGTAQLKGDNFGDAPFIIEFDEEEDTNNGNGGGSNSASDITYNNEISNATSTNVQGAIDELFQSVSNGKELIASAITDKGVPTGADASFETMKENIGKIYNAKAFYNISYSVNNGEIILTVPGIWQTAFITYIGAHSTGIGHAGYLKSGSFQTTAWLNFESGQSACSILLLQDDTQKITTLTIDGIGNRTTMLEESFLNFQGWFFTTEER